MVVQNEEMMGEEKKPLPKIPKPFFSLKYYLKVSVNIKKMQVITFSAF